MATDCLFCGIVAGDVPAQVVDADEHTIAFMDINPATRGHALVVPRNHSADLAEISDEDLERTMVAARRLTERMRTALQPDGFNVLNSSGAAAWQTIFHFHLHVVPRYDDDPLKLPWIPARGDADQIADLADRIRAAADGAGQP
jgi:histidine triad (HIT) family protein